MTEVRNCVPPQTGDWPRAVPVREIDQRIPEPSATMFQTTPAGISPSVRLSCGQTERCSIHLRQPRWTCRRVHSVLARRRKTDRRPPAFQPEPSESGPPEVVRQQGETAAYGLLRAWSVAILLSTYQRSVRCVHGEFFWLQQDLSVRVKFGVVEFHAVFELLRRRGTETSHHFLNRISIRPVWGTCRRCRYLPRRPNCEDSSESRRYLPS